MTMKYFSKNELNDFEFHDTVLSFESFSDNCLTLQATALNIHKSAEQNPHSTDMEISRARISFEGVRFLSYKYREDIWKKGNDGNDMIEQGPEIILHDQDASQRFLDQVKEWVRIYWLGLAENGVYYMDATSPENPFFTVLFTFNQIVIEWDDYKKEAWYVKS